MSKVSVFDQKWLDIVFEGRNKEYGAYQLRQQDPKTTMIALFSGIALVGALVSIPAIVNLFKDDVAVKEEVYVLPDITDTVTPVELPEKAKPIVKETAMAAPKPKEPTTRFTTPEPTAGPVQTDAPTTAQVSQTNIGNTTTQGSGGGIDIGPTSANGPENSSGTGTGDGDSVDNTPYIPATLDQAPAFPGGLDKFLSLVGQKFKTPEIEKVTTMKVLVSFIVEKDGSITGIKVLRDPGYELGKEAVRVLNSIKTKWKPGMKNGQAVRTAYSLPIVIQIN